MKLVKLANHRPVLWINVEQITKVEENDSGNRWTLYLLGHENVRIMLDEGDFYKILQAIDYQE